MLSERTLREVRRLKPRRILLQIPEGLKLKAVDVAKELEASGADVFVSCDPCFGACDLKGDEAKRLKCNVLVHVGHSSLGVASPVPVIYDHLPMKVDIRGALEPGMRLLKGFRSIGLATTLQYADAMKDAETLLRKRGFKTRANRRGPFGSRGQILGCEQGAALSMDVDCYLFIGTGLFHPLGLAARTEKPVFFLDVERRSIIDLRGDARKERIKRGLRIEKARSCRAFAVLVSTKPGQARPDEAVAIKKALEKKGKSAVILAMDRITPEAIMGIRAECLVNTACPRLADDSALFGRPVLNPDDVKEL